MSATTERETLAPRAVGPAQALWQGGLARTLERVEALAPDAGARARASLRRVLGPVTASAWPEVALSSSALTNTGLPVEFAWASRDAAVRWTADVAPPEAPEAERLRTAARLAGWDADEGELRRWQEVQRRGPLRFGAWLGMRHTSGHDSGKVYLELPAGPPRGRADRHGLLRLPGLTWRIAGVGPDGSGEFYARGPRIDADLLRWLEAVAFGSAGRLPALAGALAGGDRLPRPSGISATLDERGEVLALTWFTFAKSVLRDDAQARERITRLAAGCGPADGSLELYRALSGGAPDGRWRHAIVGAGLAVDGREWVQAGLRPT